MDSPPKESPPRDPGSSDAIESSAGPSAGGVEFELSGEAGEEDAAPKAGWPNLAGLAEAKAPNPPVALLAPKAEDP